jgi:heparinase II/III-like protein
MASGRPANSFPISLQKLAVAVGITVGTVFGGLLYAGPAGAADPNDDDNQIKVHRMEVDRALLDDPKSLAQAEALAESPVQCAIPSPDPVPDGVPIVVSLPPAAPFTVGEIPARVWRQPWVKDPTWRVYFESLSWARALAQRAKDDGQFQSLGVLVAQVLAFHTENPDPRVASYGWDEGTSSARLDTLNCLYSLTHDTRLPTPAKANAAVLLGSRYQGPPYQQVNNHGVKANLCLIRASGVFGVSSWRTTAIARIEYEAPLVFTPKGTTWEQSSMYQQVNVTLWNQAATVLGSDPVADTIRTHTRRGRAVYQWMTEPDKSIVQIGDSDKRIGGSNTGSGVSFRDDQTGWVIGRWSWTDPLTDYYTVRYGPPRRAHGHEDRGGVTWSTLGVRVLVGPGRYNYDPSSPWFVWQRSGASHNVAIPGCCALNRYASAVVRASNLLWAAHAWSIDDALYGRTHNRNININHSTRTLRVIDTFSGTDVFRQSWHLDPAWRFSARNTAGTWWRFTNPAGRVLTISTTGLFSSLKRAATSPIAGWNFPVAGTRTAAYELKLRGYARVQTTFVVR